MPCDHPIDVGLAWKTTPKNIIPVNLESDESRNQESADSKSEPLDSLNKSMADVDPARRNHETPLVVGKFRGISRPGFVITGVAISMRIIH